MTARLQGQEKLVNPEPRLPPTAGLNCRNPPFRRQHQRNMSLRVNHWSLHVWKCARAAQTPPAGSRWSDSWVRQRGHRSFASQRRLVAPLGVYLLGWESQTADAGGVCGAGTAASSTEWRRHTASGSSSSEPPANPAVNKTHDVSQVHWSNLSSDLDQTRVIALDSTAKFPPQGYNWKVFPPYCEHHFKCRNYVNTNH